GIGQGTALSGPASGQSKPSADEAVAAAGASAVDSCRGLSPNKFSGVSWEHIWIGSAETENAAAPAGRWEAGAGLPSGLDFSPKSHERKPMTVACQTMTTVPERISSAAAAPT